MTVTAASPALTCIYEITEPECERRKNIKQPYLVSLMVASGRGDHIAVIGNEEVVLFKRNEMTK
jgi:hypothetical protein